MISKLYRVTFPRHGRQVVADLLADGRWVCGDEQIESMLNRLFSPKDDYSPTTGPFGLHHAHAAASILKGEAESLESTS
jgi:hypothetical protein